MSSCWIGVAAAEHVQKGVEGGFVMFAHGRHAAAAKVMPGDWVACYSPREGMGKGMEIRAFTAIGIANTGPLGEHEMQPGTTGTYRRMKWLANARPADIYPLLDKLSFVQDKSHWGMYFRKSLFRVTQDDFAIIAEAMNIPFSAN